MVGASSSRRRHHGRDDEQYADFVDASQHRLRRTAFLLTGDWQLAADATQEALLRMYVAWPRLERSGGGLQAYARRALVSAAVDQLRRPWRREAPAEIDVNIADGSRLEDQVSNRALLLAALRRLPPRQRACVVLRYFEQFSVDETAEAMGCEPGTVKSQTARGLATLREIFGEYGRLDAIASVGEENHG
jgi:RNA polymerase sigma-70 factor (sigma-E family)